MAGALRLSTVDSVIKGLKKSRQELRKILKTIPDEDAYATPYSVIVDGINSIDELIKEMKPALKEAKKYRKQNPDQFPNRARKWCVINDSRRKQSPSTEGTDRPDPEAIGLRLGLYHV